MNNLIKIIAAFLIISTTACTHMQGHHTKNFSVPVQPIENSPLKVSIVDGAPVAILDGKVISRPLKFPHDLISGENKKISLQSIEQISLIKVKGSCLYFACVGSVCTQFAVPDVYCR